ncbi:polyamine ABC transporter ATP-binding protein [Mesorhizobium sp. Root552]|uniref:ABC transporter ATP-binding protein n=1 Tax=Mesorhizobium sp. Root552 TaxID=1736555 RepID=UPI0006F5DE49|nr:ABC transporter ATP-binding protein [Mesorhizobium sp. Root552]KQZ12499.1 polyamine ABC transporter ATP-binding protein [Mesorhizobium sp. Root552]
MQDAIVELAGARKVFASPEGGEVKALDNIYLDVRRNEFLTLLGPSGCGKTTLLQSIGGFVRLDAGTISIDGADMTRVPPHLRPVNTVFQNYALFPHMSVEQNVGYALEVRGIPARERREKVGAALVMVGLGGMEKRRPNQLSGGQQQRVALARAIVARPKLLLLDEPLSALDRGLRHSMQIELKNLQNELGISFVFVTHDKEEALTMSDRIAVLKHGRIQQIAAPREIYDRPANPFVASFIGVSNMFEGSIDSGSLVMDRGETLQLGRTLQDCKGRATAVIRPEQFSLSFEQDTRAGIDVTIDQVIFVGAGFELYARTRGGRELVVSAPASARDDVARAESDRRARLIYVPANIHLMPGEGGSQ